LLQKVGGVLKNEGLQEKGASKRAAAGNDEFSSGTSGGNYGSGNNNDNY